MLSGAVDIRDISERADGAPVFVVPRFNCLATLAEAHSFEVLWRPPFITEVVAADRCHLNGMAMVDGAPRFVTALAATDESGAWRDRKRDGGVLIDVATAEIVATGLSMPHSPRVHQGSVWLQQSGTGEFGRIDLDNGRFEAVATLPGLPRGLAFLDNWAVVGVSKPRSESGFDDLPLGERLDRSGETPRCVILVIRPLAGMFGLLGSSLNRRDRAVVSFYGVRGIGSVYYLGYASTHVEFIDEGPLWALVAFTIFASTVIHGLTASATIDMLDR